MFGLVFWEWTTIVTCTLTTNFVKVIRKAKKYHHKDFHFEDNLSGLSNICTKKYLLYFVFEFFFPNIQSIIQTKADLGEQHVQDLEYTLKLMKTHKISKKI